mmetsp:Transcript_3347/g.9218  ORF Transcript_3347/g.9218 Transcript_3347/m.9218 type:complete len:161 (+) Transcript_3347:1874-2356(+)
MDLLRPHLRRRKVSDRQDCHVHSGISTSERLTMKDEAKNESKIASKHAHGHEQVMPTTSGRDEMKASEQGLSPVKVRFRAKELREAPERVELFGDFSNWSEPVGLVRETEEDCTWSVIVPMTTGDHSVKFLVDGRWSLSDELPTCVDSDGNTNNRITVVP